MHKAKWILEGDSLELQGVVLYTYVSRTDYTMKMLAEDLLEAGAGIDKVVYEEDADTGMKYYGGELPPGTFLREYDLIREKGMGGMDYTAYCTWKGIPFRAGMADDGHGRSCNRIVITVISEKFDIHGLVRALDK